MSRGGRLPYGTGLQVLRVLAAATTDDCVEWPYAKTAGYGIVYIGEGKHERANALVCTWYHGARPFPEAEAAHHCGNRACVNPRHLRWATRKENATDKVRHGTTNIGERNGMAKLTADGVRDIRRRRASGESVGSLALKYGLNPIYVRAVIRGATWRHIPLVAS